MSRRLAVVALVCVACGETGAAPTPTATPDASVSAPDGGVVRPDEGEGHVVHEETHARLLVADADASVRVYEVDSLADPLVLAVPAPVNLAAGSMGRWVYGLAPDHALLMDTGLVAITHGEHQHLAVREPRVLEAAPFALRANGESVLGTRFGQSMLFHRGDGAVTRIDELSLRSASGVRIEHHEGEGAAAGLAVPWRDGLALVSRGERVEVRDRALLPTGPSAPCPGAGEALANGVGAVVTCADGFVLATGPGAPELAHVAAPPIARLASHPRSPAFFGAAGRSLARIDPVAKRVELVPLDAAVRALVVRDEATLVALLDDGSVATFDSVALASTGRIPAGGTLLAVDGDAAFVADDGDLRRVDLRTGGSVALPNPGRPRRLVLLRLTVNKGS